jgi:radical SAM-linked protein
LANKVAVIFRKDAGARYLSHLDLLATWEYAVRRARLPMELSEGFNPRPRLSLAAPLALGHVGEAEVVEIGLRREMPAPEVAERLAAALPVGLSVLKVEVVPPGRKPAASRLRSAAYRVRLAASVLDLPARVDRLLARSSLPVEESHAGGIRRRDVRPLLLSLAADGEDTLHLTVRLDGNGTVRPEQIEDLLELPPPAEIIRERLTLAD